MLDIDEAKLPPPRPDRKARAWNTHSGVSWLSRAMPVPAAGIINRAVVRTIVLRPPARRMKKLLGMRNVAPVNPAMAVMVNSSDCSKGKPRFSIWTVMTLQ